jgi:hypothetical protein
VVVPNEKALFGEIVQFEKDASLSVGEKPRRIEVGNIVRAILVY